MSIIRSGCYLPRLDFRIPMLDSQLTRTICQQFTVNLRSDNKLFTNRSNIIFILRLTTRYKQAFREWAFWLLSEQSSLLAAHKSIHTAIGRAVWTQHYEVFIVLCQVQYCLVNGRISCSVNRCEVNPTISWNWFDKESVCVIFYASSVISRLTISDDNKSEVFIVFPVLNLNRWDSSNKNDFEQLK